MPSNLSAIGFTFADEPSFLETMAALAGDAVERLACAPGDYAIWRSQTGAEIWFHLEGERGIFGGLENSGIVGLTPFFEADEPHRVRLLAHHHREGDSDFEGAFTAELPGDTEPAQTFVFEAVDAAAHDTRELPLETRVKLVGFAREVHVLPSAPGPADHQGSLKPLALRAAEAADNDNAATARTKGPYGHALLSGRVNTVAELTNEVTDAAFYRLDIITEAGAFALIADPAVVTGTLVAGVGVKVLCTLFGRILD